MESGYLPYGNWFFKKCCPHRSQVSTYSHGQDQVLWSYVHPGCACEPSQPCTRQRTPQQCHALPPLSHLAQPAAVAAPTSALHSHCGTNPIAHATAVNALLWQSPSPLLLPNLCSHLRGLGADVTWTGKVYCGSWKGAGAWESNTSARVDVLAGIVVWRSESWNTDWHPSWGRKEDEQMQPKEARSCSGW